MENFVNLHVHSEKSLLDGMVKVTDLVDRTMEYNQIASCITDHGNMYTIVDHFKYSQKMGQKAIAGFEAYMVGNRLDKGNTEQESEQIAKRNHFLLLAKNYQGYQKLNRICSKGYQDGFYYRPRIDNNVLEMFLDKKENDVIGTSACIAGILPQLILANNIEEADRYAKYYQELFGGNFWLEIQPTEIYEQFIVNKALIEMSKRLSIPIITTTDAHYLNKEDKETHDILLCLQSKTTITNPNRWSFNGNSYYVMNEQEIREAYKKVINYKKIKKAVVKKKSKKAEQNDFTYEYIYDYDEEKYNNVEMLPNFIECVESGTMDFNEYDPNIIDASIKETVNIANQCNLSFSFNEHHLPKVNIPVEEPNFKHWRESHNKHNPNDEDYLRYLCIQSLRKKIRNGIIKGEIKEEDIKIYKERLETELKTINDMKFPGYFLIYYDIAKYCKDNNVPIGPGRGCLIEECNVETNKDVKSIKDINIGDKVYCHDEMLHEVVAKHKYAIDEPIANFECGDKKIKGITLDHKIYAIKKKDFDNGIRNPQWYPAKELNEGDYICEKD